MDIESKRWRIITGRVPGQAELRDKRSGVTHWPDLAKVPDANRLALMHESEFNRTMESLT